MLETLVSGGYVRVALKSGERIHSTFSGYELEEYQSAQSRLDNQEASWWRAEKPVGTPFVNREFWNRYSARNIASDGTCEIGEELDELFIVVPISVWRKYGLSEPEVNALGTVGI